MGDILYDIKTVLAGINGGVLDERFAEAVQRLDQFVSDVETEVCPDWDSAPEWAQWWAVDADGAAFWYEYAPVLLGHYKGAGKAWWPADISGNVDRDVTHITLPKGYDWRISLHWRP